jgi:hypothetical protein
MNDIRRIIEVACRASCGVGSAETSPTISLADGVKLNESEPWAK